MMKMNTPDDFSPFSTEVGSIVSVTLSVFTSLDIQANQSR